VLYSTIPGESDSFNQMRPDDLRKLRPLSQISAEYTSISEDIPRLAIIQLA
jgi:hypothetical protein